MLKGKSIVAVIPARAGSKGIKNKNIVPLKGKPLIYYCIEEARESGIFDRIVVSTDGLTIKDIVEFQGVEVIDRPEILAKDETPTEPVIAHALKQLGNTYDLVQLIEPTSPLVQAIDFKEAANYLISSKADLVIGVSKATNDVIFPLGDNHSIKHAYPKEYRRKGRQLIPPMYFINGCIYVGKWEVFYNEKDFYEVDVRGHCMPSRLCCDINYYPDLAKAELELDRREAYQHVMKHGNPRRMKSEKYYQAGG